MKRIASLAAPLALIALGLSGCGLKPLYTGGGSGAVATTLTRIQVAPIEGKAGWLMTNALNDRLSAGGATPLYRLEVRLDDKITGLGVRRDDSVAREP
jgi:LPS-assembly lipoprotein